MNAREAMIYAARDGLKVRKVDWPKGVFVQFMEDGSIKGHPLGYGNVFSLEEEWEIYQEPPKEYTFLELFDVLKEDEYATFDGWRFVFVKGHDGLSCEDPSGEIAGFHIARREIEAKYIIKKKPSQPVKEKEGFSKCRCGNFPFGMCSCPEVLGA